MNSQKLAHQILSGIDKDGKQIISREWEPLARELAESVVDGGWISVGDSLPANSGCVLVLFNGVYVSSRLLYAVGYYEGNSDFLPEWCNAPNGDSIDVTHWMPLPSPPKGE